MTKGKREEPVKLFLYAIPGIGKTTLLSESDRPLVIDVENGSHHLDVARISQEHVNTWEKLIACIDAIGTRPEYDEFKTIGIDTVDAMEKMLWNYLIRRDKPEIKEGNSTLSGSIEAYGYNKGYTVAVEECRKLLARLERLRVAKGKNIVLLGHSSTKKVPNPLGVDFEAYRPAINEKLAALLGGWSDVVVFGQYHTVTTQSSKRSKAKVNIAASGARILHTSPSPAWEAKTRYPMPKEMPFEASAFWGALKRGMTDEPGRLRKEIENAIAELKDTTVVTVDGVVTAVSILATKQLETAGDQTTLLSRLLDRVMAKLREQQSAEPEVNEEGEDTKPAEIPEVAEIPAEPEDQEPPADVVLPTFGEPAK